ncbi:hypothetical protein [Clostridium rectalis]|uniref:hypothetical protein n=1 Tax=Clostridium rectalis TaxID=2040295 RepID=UPI000F6300A1|nr:hypothetical protein [Clostridium rectalis]
MKQLNKKSITAIIVVVIIGVIGTMYFTGRNSKIPQADKNIVVRTIDNLTGKTERENKKVEEEKKKKEEEKRKQEEANKVNQDKNFTEKVKKENGILDGQVYTQGDYVCGTMLIKENSISQEEVKKLAEKYANELKAKYKNKKVNVQAVQNGKNLANITK